MTKIAIWALDGGLSSTIAGTIDVFHVANLLWKNRHPDTNASPFQWQLASPSGQPVRTDSGVMISVDAAIDPSVDVDIVLVPGIVATTATEIEAAIDHNALLVASLRKQRERGATIAVNCASTFFLAESNESSARAAGVEPLGRLVAYAHAAVDPKVMGLGPIPAVERVLARAKLSLSDIDVIECNEAFAAQACAVSQVLNFDPARVNPNGGAVALGHPIGATGAILAIKLLYELQRTRGRYGLVTLCIGGGQGIAAIFARE